MSTIISPSHTAPSLVAQANDNKKNRKRTATEAFGLDGMGLPAGPKVIKTPGSAASLVLVPASGSTENHGSVAIPAMPAPTLSIVRAAKKSGAWEPLYRSDNTALDPMSDASLLALSAVDGRYTEQVRDAREYLSEAASHRYRLVVEVEWLIFLAARLHEHDPVKYGALQRDVLANVATLRQLYEKFSLDDARAIKKFEKETKHDVKALEYFLKSKLAGTVLEKHLERVHFGLTSQDINNTAQPLALGEFRDDVLLPAMEKVEDSLVAMAKQWWNQPMLARTHGQPATTVYAHTELLIMLDRLCKVRADFCDRQLWGKFGGATGQWNAAAATVDLNWPRLADDFLAALGGMPRQQFTGQIAQYDDLAAFLDTLALYLGPLTKLSWDMWDHISRAYIKPLTKAGEVGSSTMPHKTNPIDFELGISRMGMAAKFFVFIAEKLQGTRGQRDLTDSSALREIPNNMGSVLVALSSLQVGLGKSQKLDDDAVRNDLMQHWELLAEPIQTILRDVGYPNPYEKLKEATRGVRVTRESIQACIEEILAHPSIPQEQRDSLRTRLLALTPYNYLGQLPPTLLLLQGCPQTWCFLSGNAGKRDELQALWPNSTLHALAVDLPEEQSKSCEVVSRGKLSDAKKTLRGLRINFMAEDSGLHVGTPDASPGALIKWEGPDWASFVKQMECKYGAQPQAWAACAISACVGGKRIYTQEAKVEGNLVPPRGTHGFGWDAVFQPKGSTLTWGEMTAEQKAASSARAKAVQQMQDLLATVASEG